MENENKGSIKDLLGIAPYGEAIKIAVERGFDGASAVLSRICLPAAEELGLMYRDKLRHSRLKRVLEIMEKSAGKIDFSDGELQLSVHPRVIHEVIAEGSWCEDEVLQNMWSGLLVSSIDVGVPTDSNILFINKLKQLTSVQAKIINHICSNCKIRIHNTYLVVGGRIDLTSDEIIELTGMDSVEQLDAEIDSLRAIELINGGFEIDSNPLTAYFFPSAFVLLLYAKSQGFKGRVIDFYKDQIVPHDANDESFHRPVEVLGT